MKKKATAEHLEAVQRAISEGATAEKSPTFQELVAKRLAPHNRTPEIIQAIVEIADEIAEAITLIHARDSRAVKIAAKSMALPEYLFRMVLGDGLNRAYTGILTDSFWFQEVIEEAKRRTTKASVHLTDLDYERKR